MLSWRKIAAAAAVLLAVNVSPALADTFSGTLYYTLYSGQPNVWKINYDYNDATSSFNLGAPTPLASLAGADGIIFDANGHLLVGGQNTGLVYMLDPTTGAVLDTGSAPTGSFHLALDPSGNFVYTSNFEGALETLTLTSTQLTTTTVNAVNGNDTGVTQLAFAPNSGNVFYVNGNPNGFGDVGFYNLATNTTTRLATSFPPAHGLIYDSYTGLMTMFGDGFTGTFDQFGVGFAVSPGQFACDFDQGAVDGHGHALVAGCGAITFLDYSVSHDITHPNHVFVNGGFGAIDDVAPLSGLGSNEGGGDNPVPEPASLLLLGTGLAGAVARRYRARKAA